MWGLRFQEWIDNTIFVSRRKIESAHLSFDTSLCLYALSRLRQTQTNRQTDEKGTEVIKWEEKRRKREGKGEREKEKREREREKGERDREKGEREREKGERDMEKGEKEREKGERV